MREGGKGRSKRVNEPIRGKRRNGGVDKGGGRGGEMRDAWRGRESEDEVVQKTEGKERGGGIISDC